MSRNTKWTDADVLHIKVRQHEQQVKALPRETANGITANILRMANLQPGCVAYRVNNVGVWDEAKQVHRKGNTEKGLPDVIVIHRGRFIAVEVKAGRDKLSEHQLMRKFEIERAGGVYFEARSTDAFAKFFIELLKS